MIRYKNILYATDFSERAQLAFEMACSLAADHGARLTVLHVLPPIADGFAESLTQRDYIEEARGHARSRLANLKPGNPAIEMDTRIEEGNPAGVILDVARELGAELIVLGTHGRTGLARAIMGSVAEEVVRKARCPVVVVKSPMPGSTSPLRPVRLHAQT